MQLESILTCPQCGFQSAEQMPTDACQFFYICEGCGQKLKPLAGDCCVFCRSGLYPAPRSRKAGKARVADDYGSAHIFRYLNLGGNA